ncbi:hypothetical protein PS925_03827 [Pseudomonas fluorescens]|uniref:Uncharacterized protein n=1 Tax=Pseudomonas fluorescens TaxID=294 RepID=A0A5E7UWP0_PSEFL|nr:hypothetical protein [Pseudomonas fluorescens]VVQ13868.1 hypothetical protein PS925_03827 [Pseudomonas fluorescens]
MAKPPKKIPGTAVADPTTGPRSPAAESADISPVPGAAIDTVRVGEQRMADLTPHVPTGELTPPPSVLVSDLPAHRPLSPDTALRSLTWPAENLHLLIPLDIDSGLSTSADGRIYAAVENEGHLLVERQSDGRYQIPFDFAPGVPGPFISKIRDQSLWRFEIPDWLVEDSGRPAPFTPPPGPIAGHTQTYLAPHLAARLSPATDSPDAIRYDRYRKTYVDTAEGTVMVGKNDKGDYQQTSAADRHPSGVFLERMPGTLYWRQKNPQTSARHDNPRQDRRRPATPTDSAPGPGKRSFMGNDADSASDTQALAQSLISSSDGTLDLSHGAWRDWGKTTPWPLETHIEIDNLYYPVVTQTLIADTPMAYMKHPRFSPDLYDSFERMLVTDPALQPRWVVKINDRWSVLGQRLPFELPLTQYISAHFKYLTEESTSFVARAMYNQANRSEIINGHGLAVLNQTLRLWADRTNNKVQRQDLAEPLCLLRKLPPLNEAQRSSALPSSLGEGLQRLDFDPGQFAQLWIDHVVLPATPELRKLFSAVLTKNGYRLEPATLSTGENTLLFHREKINSLFVLTFPAVSGQQIQRNATPGIAWSDTDLQIRMGEKQQTLATYREEQRLVHLLGGIDKRTQRLATLFIVREG